MTTPKYHWHQNVRRYRSRNGRFVSQDAVTKDVHDTTENFKQSVLDRTNKMLDDFSMSSFTKWAISMRAEIKAMHNSVTMIALGGREASIAFSTKNAEVWRQAEIQMNTQLSYFDRFMLQAVSGSIQFNGAFATRAGMYADAGYTTYQNVIRLREFEAGQDEERRTLGFVLTHHCDDCIVEADLGWQGIGTLKRIGDTQCGSRCKCNFEFRKTS